MGQEQEPVIGIVGGTGFYDMPGIKWGEVHELRDTPFGKPSEAMREGSLNGRKVFFLNRHGPGHRLSPSVIPYAANIFEFIRSGATHLIGFSAMGSLNDDFKPGSLHIVEQYLDFTKLRQSSFFYQGVVAHAGMADPFCPDLSRKLLLATEAGQSHQVNTITIEGPQFSTRLESKLYRSWGLDMIGMTTATEAKLAREAGLCYAVVGLATDFDSWRGAGESDEVSVAVVERRLAEMKDRAIALLLKVIPAIKSVGTSCSCPGAMDKAWATAQQDMDPQKRKELGPLLRRVL